MTPLTFPSFLLFAIYTDPIFHWRGPRTVFIEVQIKGRRLSASNLLLRALRSPSGSGVLLGSEQRKVSYSFRSRKATTLNVTSSGHFTESARFERTSATARRKTLRPAPPPSSRERSSSPSHPHLYASRRHCITGPCAVSSTISSLSCSVRYYSGPSPHMTQTQHIITHHSLSADATCGRS